VSSQQRYQWVDAAMVRVTTGGDGLMAVPWPDLDRATNEQMGQWRAWLAQVWAHRPVVEAIEVASPVLARQVAHLHAGHEFKPQQLRRMVLSVAKYVLRMTGRATPFGLFAGVAPLRFGTEVTVRWGEGPRVTARPDAAWLSSVVTYLEGCPQLLRRLTVVANNLCFVRDDRLVVPCQSVNDTGPDEPAEVSVRHTSPVETVVRAARSPVGVDELAGKLAADHPATPPMVIEAMLAELVRRGVLLTCLRPAMTVTDPLGHVLGQLAAVGAETISEVGPHVRRLQTVHNAMARHNHTRSARVRRRLRTTAAERMAAISTVTERLLAVDLRIDCQIELPQQVVREAQTAASLLTGLTPYSTGSAGLRDYHRRFVDRYGTGALVPVRDLVDADTGLGYPAGYRESILNPPTPAVSERDLRLLALAQTAAMAGDREVILDEATVASLEVEPEPPVAPHTDLCVQVHAPTRQALAQGEFDLLVVGAARAAGTMTGRFLHLLDPADRDRMASAYRQLPTLDPDAVPAQVSCPPLYARTGNVARAPATQPRVISLAEYPTGGENSMIPLDELAVGADTSRLYLMSPSSYRLVEPTMFQAVAFRNHIHPLARFLCEITTGYAAACTPFLWEAATGLPFLPRLRYGRIVLAAARWRLSAANLPDHRAPWAQWARAVADWRHRFRVPDRVCLGEGDQRLRLDLDQPLHLALLRAHLDRTGHAVVHEPPTPDAFGWLDGRPHEIVIPMAATRQPARPRAPRPRSAARIGREHGHRPGDSPWLSIRLYAHPDRQATILTDHLPRLLSAWDHAVRWWFLRYSDPQPHLRLRLKAIDGYGLAAERVGAWATDLRRRGLANHLLLDTYYPEVGRYGNGEVLAAAEAVFVADSSAAVAQIAAAAGGNPNPQALCAASFVDLAIALTGGVADGLQWLVDQVKRQATPALPRDLHDDAIRLANPHDRGAGLRALPGGQRAAAAWAQRRTALAGYRHQLDTTVQPGPTPVLASLLHMHHARVFGVKPDSEKTCHRLARAAALSWTTRTVGATP
jgi:thiopeptide-type bacteriocin biosynthesis protein